MNLNEKTTRTTTDQINHTSCLHNSQTWALTVPSISREAVWPEGRGGGRGEGEGGDGARRGRAGREWGGVASRKAERNNLATEVVTSTAGHDGSVATPRAIIRLKNSPEQESHTDGVCVCV